MMNQIGTWIRRRPIVSFFVITFVISRGLRFSAVAILNNEQFLLMPLAVVTACAPALAGIIVTAVGGGQSRPALGHNRARWSYLMPKSPKRLKIEQKASRLIAT